MKIGVYSGTFDPIHYGHILFAHHAAKQVGLDKVYFLVEAEPRRKTGVTKHRDRLNMAWLATREHPHLGVLEVDEPTFSVAGTLPQLQGHFASADLYLLLGADLWNVAHTWPGFERLAGSVRFVVGVREGHELAATYQSPHVITTRAAHLTSTMARGATPAALQHIVPHLVASYIVTNKLYEQDV